MRRPTIANLSAYHKKTKGKGETIDLEKEFLEKFEKIVILFGTSTDYHELILEKGKPHSKEVGFWKTKFAIVDFE